MKGKLLFAVVLPVFLLLAPAGAGALVIDFEGIDDGTAISSQYSGLGVRFSGPTAATAGISLNEFECPPHSGMNAALDSGGWIRIRFDSPVSGFGAYFTYSRPLALTFYDPLNKVLGTAHSRYSSNMALSGDPGSSPNEYLDFSSAPLAQVLIAVNFGGPLVMTEPVGTNYFAMDDVTIGSVPEPQSIFLLAAVLPLILLYRAKSRRRRPGVLAGILFFSIMAIGSEALAAPVVPRPSFDPPALYAGLSTPVTFRVELPSPASIVGSVNLILSDESGRSLSILGTFHDDGVNGDERAGDGIYTLRKEFLGKDAGRIWVRVSVPYRGLAKRVLSNAAALPVYSSNKPPVARDQSVTTQQDIPAAIRLAATDEYGDPLTYSIVSPPGKGTLTGVPPQMIYAPAFHYFGPDSFTFKASDGRADSNTATVSITVTERISRGTVSGVVTNEMNGSVVPGAAASLTDAGNRTQTVLTDGSGKYSLEGVLEGPFAGSISKDGFRPCPFSGTAVAGETLRKDFALNPILPAISGIEVTGLTPDSATITWTTDQPADSRVDYGTNPSYGNWARDPAMSTSHAVKIDHLTPATSYHYRVTSANSFAFAASSGDLTFTTQGPLLTMEILSPGNGAALNRPDVLVRGRVVNARGNETGVTVNGKLATITGNEFAANHIPLTAGANAIVAEAKDTEGNTASASITVQNVPPGEALKLTANVESGIAPLEVLLVIDSSMELADLPLTYTGPGEAEVTPRSTSEYRVKLGAEGVYYFTAHGISGTGPYDDSVAITVVSRTELEPLLKGKWDGMKTAILNGNVDGAMAYFASGIQDRYRAIIDRLGAAKLIGAVSSISDIKVYDLNEGGAEGGALRNETGGIYSYPITFVKDENGIWKILGF